LDKEELLTDALFNRNEEHLEVQEVSAEALTSASMLYQG